MSILFMHENWASSELIPKMIDLAEGRKLEDLTIGHVLTVTTESMWEHIEKLLEIPGAKRLFEGEPLENHSIPKVYCALKLAVVYIPLHETLKYYNFEFVASEIFGCFQIITDYKQYELQMMLDACERMHAHLTTVLVSNDLLFLQDVLRRSVNGTTYAGIRARTTGAPQNHWFGPAVILGVRRLELRKRLNLFGFAIGKSYLTLDPCQRIGNSTLRIRWLFGRRVMI